MEQTSMNHRTIAALRKCGHHLHHNAGYKSGVDEENLLNMLTDDEKATLCELLEKCLQGWNS